MATFTSTTKWALRWLTGTNAISDIDAGFQALAEDIDAVMAGQAAGTLASRPAAGKAGRFYRATDTGQVFLDTGSAWMEPMPPIWRTLLAPNLVDESVTAGAEHSMLSANIASSQISGAAFYFDPADYAVEGKTTKLRLRSWGFISSSAAGSFQVKLRPATTFNAGGYPTGWGAALATNSHSIANPSTPLPVNVVTSAEFDAPAAGVYDITGTLSVSVSAIIMGAMLQIRNV